MSAANEYELLLSSVSHEIRNPVTLINSYLQLLANDCPDVRASSSWEIIRGEMDRLILLLNDFSVYQNGLRLQPARTDIADWLQNYARTLQPIIKQRPDVCFSCQADPDLPALSLDGHKLRQVLDNLVRNALEAMPCPPAAPDGETPEHKWTLSIHARGQGAFVYLCVRDNGCGIRPEDLDTLFHPFVTHKNSGSGLGLAICRRIMRAHGGDITCVSLKDPTEFRLSLPAEIPR